MAIEPSKGIVILQVSWRFADYYKSGFSFSKSLHFLYKIYLSDFIKEICLVNTFTCCLYG